MASKDIHVPDLGSFKDVAVIDVLVKPGDSVEVDTPLLTLETEKATMDVPSSAAGIVEKLHVGKGSHVSTGSLIATLSLAAGAAASNDAAPATDAAKTAASRSATDGAAPPRTAAAGAQASVVTTEGAPGSTAVSDTGQAARRADPTSRADAGAVSSAKTLPPVGEAGFARAHAGPSVRKLARELGVDLVRVRGTGQKGRIMAEDLKAFVKSVFTASDDADSGAGAGAWPRVNVPDFSQFGPIEARPLHRVQRIAGLRLQASWVNLPHVTQFDEADITELEETRKTLKARADSAGIKLTTLAFVVRACVKALQKFPQFNASLDASGENLIYKKYLHIGFAADTPNGLLVPVMRNADGKDIYETARTLAELADKARTGKLSGAQMQGGSFTISSLGGIGGTAFTPIINAPEVAILGVSRSSIRPVYRDGGFVPRLMLPLSLSYDHRVIDGAAAVRFTSYLGSVLADVRGLVEAVP